MFASFIQELIWQGISEHTIAVLLFLPIVAALVTFSRYVIGWKSLNIFSTVLMTFALYELGRMSDGTISIINGFIQGTILTFFVTLTALLVQKFTKNVRLHQLSKVSMILSFTTIVILGLLYIGTAVDFSLRPINSIAVLIIVLVVDVFIRMYIRKGWRKAIKLLANTMTLSFFIFAIIAQPSLKYFVLAHPEVVLLTLLIDVILGRWKHLRFTELIRFRNISLKEQENAEDSS